MDLKYVPSVVVVVDRSGMPLLTLPHEDKFALIGSLASAAIAMSEKVPSGEIDYIKTETGILYIKLIGKTGGLLMLFENVRDPNEVYWVVYLFINEVKNALSFVTEGFITESEMQGMRVVYNNFVDRLKKIDMSLSGIQEKYSVLKEVAGSVADITLKRCSDGILRESKTGIVIDIKNLEEKEINSVALLDIVNRCLEELDRKLKQILAL